MEEGEGDGGGGGRSALPGSGTYGLPDERARADGGVSKVQEDFNRISTLFERVQSKWSADPSRAAEKLLDGRTDVQCELSAVASSLSRIDALLDTSAKDELVGAGGSVGIAEANEAHDTSIPVGVGDAPNSVCVSEVKRARLEGHSGHHAAAAAASRGGQSGGPQQDGQTQDQQQQQQQVVCGPCLCSLEGPLLCEMASFLTTIEATVLCRLSKDIRSKADYTGNTHTTEGKTDDTPFGVYRNLTIAKDECRTWQRLDRAPCSRLREKLGHVTTACIQDRKDAYFCNYHYTLSFVTTCLEASRASLKHIYTTGFIDREDAPVPLRPPVAFDKLETLHVTSSSWNSFFRESNWTFPSLVDLRLRTLTTADSWHTIDGEWCEFASALGQCPYLTTIRGLGIGGNSCSHLTHLQKALDTHWGKEQNRCITKTIEFVYGSPTISTSFGDETHPLHDFLTWAGRVGVAIEWRLGKDFFLECNKGASSSVGPPAVRGPVAGVVKDAASEAAMVHLYLGGTPLHRSWKDLLTFPDAGILLVDEGDSSSTIESIPTWLLEVDDNGNNVRFPKIDYLDALLGFVADGDAPPEEAWHLPAAPNSLTTLLGSLRGVRLVEFTTSSLSTVCECLSHMSTDKLDVLEVCVGSHLTALPDPIPHYTLPAVHRLVVPIRCGMWAAVSKAAALSCMRLALLTHAHEAEFEFYVASDQFDFHRDYGELEGGDEAEDDEDEDEDAAWERERELCQAMEEHGKGCMRALATECYEVVKGGYQLTDVDVGCHVEHNETTMQLMSYGHLQLKVLAKGAIAGGEDRGVMTD
ncbi:unnamed protein product [Vitrella brassicaformis CCMP3155]|uniref:Uncharacterized protein n=1 Tax=Vitrella brassicaformis (strain CCMP3155) TaxID=1169540 RepID=A0A0G4F545_VITBC|nr:unnamed protein product [Vitrella brassicaformis CCMP3155]|eukprot:CEM07062.1 unnamed protein product [Vitrella brassicaformis CCMP3155]